MGMQNIVGAIIGIKKKEGHNLYNVATRYGCVTPLLSRNQFEICRQKNLIGTETLDKERTAEGSGKCPVLAFIFCRCAKDSCKCRRCFCRRNNTSNGVNMDVMSEPAVLINNTSCTERCQHGRDVRTGRVDNEIAGAFSCSNK